MKHKACLILLCSVLLVLCNACNDIPGLFEVRVTVMDADSWTPEDHSLDNVEGAVAMLFKDSDRLLEGAARGGSSDETGTAVIVNVSEGLYYLEVSKDDQSNTLFREVRDNRSLAFVIDGIVHNQEMADNSPHFQGRPTVPGDVIIIDVNADGILNDLDKIMGQGIYISRDQDVTVYIASESRYE